jgi:hypothetical protein
MNADLKTSFPVSGKMKKYSWRERKGRERRAGRNHMVVGSTRLGMGGPRERGTVPSFLFGAGKFLSIQWRGETGVSYAKLLGQLPWLEPRVQPWVSDKESAARGTSGQP